MGILNSIFGRRQHTVTVTVYDQDASFERRRALRDAVIGALEQTGLGEYLGGGTMITADREHYNIEFAVKRTTRAWSVICDTLRLNGAGPTTEWSVDNEKPQTLHDQAGA